MGVGVVRMRRGGMLWLGLRVGVVGVRSYLTEIHDWKDQGKTNPQGSRTLFAVRPHILQIKWDFYPSQLFQRDCVLTKRWFAGDGAGGGCRNCSWGNGCWANYDNLTRDRGIIWPSC